MPTFEPHRCSLVVLIKRNIKTSPALPLIKGILKSVSRERERERHQKSAAYRLQSKFTTTSITILQMCHRIVEKLIKCYADGVHSKRRGSFIVLLLLLCLFFSAYTQSAALLFRSRDKLCKTITAMCTRFK